MRLLPILISLPSWFMSPFWEFLFLVVGIEFLTPRIWHIVEFIWWKMALGNSPHDRDLRKQAQSGAASTTEHLRDDRGIPYLLALPLTVVIRAAQMKQLTTTYRRRRAEGTVEQLQESIRQVNEMWELGQPARELNSQLQDIHNTAQRPGIDPELRFHANCVRSVLNYATGYVILGNEIGKTNWLKAHQLESIHESTCKSLAAYGFFFSTLFRGQCGRAIELMTNHWNRYYATLGHEEAEKLRALVSGKLILNPILAIPRHLFLAFTLAERKYFERKEWPNEAALQLARTDNRPMKLVWFESWYAVATSICKVEPISMNFSHTYAGFFLTIMMLEGEVPAATLQPMINKAFDQVDSANSIVSQYVHAGFKGIHQLIIGANKEAWDNLNTAAAIKARTGNRFADCFFTCAQAVAGARLGRSNKVVRNQLAMARCLAENTLKSDLFTRLCDAAEAAVCLHRGDKVYARMFAERSKQGRPDSRILRMFEDDVLDSVRTAVPLLLSQ